MAADPRAVTDGVLAGGLVTSPVWVSWLGDFNEVLTSLTLIIGLALGVGRLWQFLRQRKD